MDDVVENPQHPHYCNPPFLYIDCLRDMEHFYIYKSVANVLLISKRPKSVSHASINHCSSKYLHEGLYQLADVVDHLSKEFDQKRRNFDDDARALIGTKLTYVLFRANIRI
nr:myosin-2 isoform X1 [Tanacetum cinerariifolium]